MSWNRYVWNSVVAFSFTIARDTIPDMFLVGIMCRPPVLSYARFLI